MDFNKLAVPLFIIAMTSGCAIEPVEYSYYEEDTEYVDNEYEDSTEESVLTASSKRSTNVEIDSYAKVAEQIMWDWRGKMTARDGLTYVPPIRKCGINIPGYKYGHAVVLPSQDACVDVAPGHYIDEATIYVPEQLNRK